MRRLLICVLVAVFLLTFTFIGVGCKEEATTAEKEVTEEGAPTEESTKKVLVGIDVKTLDNEYFVNILDGAREEAEKRGWELIDVQCANDPELQQQIMSDFAVRGVDIVVTLCSTDATTMESIISPLTDAGIPVVGLDSGLLGSEVTIYGCDDIPAGEQQAQWLVDKIGEEGNVVILEGIPQSTAMNRLQGNLNVFEKYSGITVTTEIADWDMEKGMTVMEDMLQKFDKIDGVTAGNDMMALGALAAVEGAGRLDEMLIAGWDGIADAIKAIKDGKLAATVWADSNNLGRQGIIVAEKILNDEAFDYVTREFEWGSDKAIILETKMIDSSNVNELFPE